MYLLLLVGCYVSSAATQVIYVYNAFCLSLGRSPSFLWGKLRQGSVLTAVPAGGPKVLSWPVFLPVQCGYDAPHVVLGNTQSAVGPVQPQLLAEARHPGVSPCLATCRAGLASLLASGVSVSYAA